MELLISRSVVIKPYKYSALKLYEKVEINQHFQTIRFLYIYKKVFVYTEKDELEQNFWHSVTLFSITILKL